MNFRDTIGHVIEAAATGAVGTAKSLMAYVKQIVTNTETINTSTAATAVGRVQIVTTTEDLNQAASTYDLLTGTTQAVILEGLSIKMPTGAAGGALTSISIQTDDATPGVIFNSTDGAVANLTSEAELSWTGMMKIEVGTKIQLTINGGAHGSEYITKITAKYRAIVAGGTLA